MGKFNLLNEPWIVAMADDKGTAKEVSLTDIFENAHLYKRLAGETSAQDFSILRLLLAIMHTVFSRFDVQGKPYEWLDLDEKYIQKGEINSDDAKDYRKALRNTWKSLWDNKDKGLPNIINKYLRMWEEHFYLYAERHPFYQVSAADLQRKNISRTGQINAKLINRLISESNNKIELFSPASKENKNKLKDGSLARWIVMFQGYTGTGDKAKFPEGQFSASKGWLLGLGGIYLAGDTLLETLLLNLNIVSKGGEAVQRPVWEKTLDENLAAIFSQSTNNLAELYTWWSRLLYIDPETDLTQNEVTIGAVQLPGIQPQDFFLEPMTLWRPEKRGKEIQGYLHQKHNINQSFWRSFGHLCPQANNNNQDHIPGIIDWHNRLIDQQYVSGKEATIVATGLIYKVDASSMPIADIYDEICVHDEVLADIKGSGWALRITEEVEIVKEVIENILKTILAKKLQEIRNQEGNGLVEKVAQEAYHAIDIPFKVWLSSIRPQDEKESKVREWRCTLLGVIKNQADKLIMTAGKRDYLGRQLPSGYSNIEIAHAQFMKTLYVTLFE